MSTRLHSGYTVYTGEGDESNITQPIGQPVGTSWLSRSNPVYCTHQLIHQHLCLQNSWSSFSSVARLATICSRFLIVSPVPSPSCLLKLMRLFLTSPKFRATLLASLLCSDPWFLLHNPFNFRICVTHCISYNTNSTATGIHSHRTQFHTLRPARDYNSIAITSSSTPTSTESALLTNA